MRASLLSTLLVAAAAWAPPSAAPVHADTPVVSVHSVKAAFLCKFAGYVEWPRAAAADASPLTIGVLGSAEMADELARITAGRTVNQRPVHVRQLSEGESLEGLQILFIGTDGGESLAASLHPALGLPILTVTDAPGALTSGSMINFTVDRDRVRFEVSLPAAERGRLKLSSRLLAVAQRVEREPGS